MFLQHFNKKLLNVPFLVRSHTEVFAVGGYIFSSANHMKTSHRTSTSHQVGIQIAIGVAMDPDEAIIFFVEG